MENMNVTANENQEAGELALIGAIFGKAYSDFKECKEAEKNATTHRAAKKALRNMRRTFCDEEENGLLVLYCSTLNIEPQDIFREFSKMYEMEKMEERNAEK